METDTDETAHDSQMRTHNESEFGLGADYHADHDVIQTKFFSLILFYT